jgi:hypothetical protein
VREVIWEVKPASDGTRETAPVTCAPLTYEEILKNVLKHHPESKFNRKHLAWYKNKLKEDNKKE